jgi:hypothetical protein
MKKYLVFLILIILSCQKDEVIIEPTPVYNIVFESNTNTIIDGQSMSFNIEDINTYQLILLNGESVITKEIFESTIGLNTRKIYTKSLLPNQYQLVLQKGSQIMNTTFIIVE